MEPHPMPRKPEKDPPLALYKKLFDQLLKEAAFDMSEPDWHRFLVYVGEEAERERGGGSD